MSEMWELGQHPAQAEVHDPIVDPDAYQDGFEPDAYADVVEGAVAVYVPLDKMISVDAGSGVVGRPAGDRIEVYYEGNRFGYANVKTYADRVSVAAGRMRESYPTVARMWLRPEQVAQVGVFEDGEVRVLHEPLLEEWLKVDAIAASELVVST